MISEKDIQYIAGLSRIHLKPDEMKKMTQDLEQILDYIAKLEKLDTKEVKPTSHVLPLKNVYRSDDPETSLNQQEALSFSIEKAKGSFKVPKVIE